MCLLFGTALQNYSELHILPKKKNIFIVVEQGKIQPRTGHEGQEGE